MKKFICIALASVMALSLAACGAGEANQTVEVKEPVVTEAAKLTGVVSTDGSTSMEKVFSLLLRLLVTISRTSKGSTVIPSSILLT